MEHRLTTASGLEFHCQSIGCEDAARTVIALHGFGGSGADFSHLAGRFSARWLLPDWFGHGQSPLRGCPPDSVLAVQIELLDTVVRSVARPVDLLGYSMGARIALHYLVGKRPECIQSAFLIGGSPGLEGDDERRQRLGADRRWAALLRRAGLAEFRRRWTRQPVLASRLDPTSALGLDIEASRQCQDPWALAACIDGLSPGRLPSLWSDLATVRVPLTLIVGETDTKFVAINRRMLDQLVTARLEVIPDAGHAAHLDNPEAVSAIIQQDFPGG